MAVSKLPFNIGELRFIKNLGSSDDVNNLSGTGFWRTESTVPAHFMSGWTWCFLFQFVIGSVTLQYAFKPTSGSFMMREYTGNPQVWSDWIVVTGYSSPVRITYGSNSYIEYWRNGIIGCVKMFINTSDVSLTSWSTKEVAIIPTGFRPAQVIMQRGCVDRATDEGTCFSVDSNGSVKVQTRFNPFNTSSDVLQGTITYPIRY